MGSTLWAPRRAPWWMAVLFSAGSLCFLVGPWPAFLDLVGPQADATVFFVGSLLFTSAATLQWRGRGPSEGWADGIQLLGTLFFNVTTFRALTTTVGDPAYDVVVWRPDAYGSVCFLVSGAMAYAAVAGGLLRRPPRTTTGVVAAVNLAGCVAFGASAVAAWVVPTTGSPLDVAVANSTTSLGALCFLVGALLLLPGP